MQCEMYNENSDSKLNLTPKERLESLGKIVIDWQSDHSIHRWGTYICEGAMIYKDGELFLDRHPDAVRGYDYTREEIIHDLLVKLGYEVVYIEETNSD